MISESRSMYITAETEWKKIVTIKLQEICCSNDIEGKKTDIEAGLKSNKPNKSVTFCLPSMQKTGLYRLLLGSDGFLNSGLKHKKSTFETCHKTKNPVFP